MQDQNGGQMLLATIEERGLAEVTKILGRRDMLDESGEPDMPVLTQHMLDLVLTARVNTPAERAKKAITRPQYMAAIFPEVSGESEWIEQEDPELAAEVYKQIDGLLWRLTSVEPTGQIQSRLNGEQGLVLCRQAQTRGNPVRIYVTRNPSCILEDLQKKTNKSLEKLHVRAAALATLAIERVPEHAGKFGRSYNASARLAITTGKAKVQAALDAAKTDDNGDDGE